jgi:D-alanyl-D-alanine carboxypeptidase
MHQQNTTADVEPMYPDRHSTSAQPTNTERSCLAGLPRRVASSVLTATGHAPAAHWRRTTASLIGVLSVTLATWAWPTAAAAQTGGATEPGYAAELRTRLEATMQQNDIPGALIGVWSPSAGDWEAALGTADLDSGAPMRLDDHMRVGSVAKTMTATIVLQLVDEGKLGLDQPLSDFRPDVPGAEAITIRQMLNMTSGLFDYGDDPALHRALDEHPEQVWTAEQLVEIGLQHPPYFAPGQGWHYSNTNYALLGLIAEQLTNEPLGQLFQEHLFGPLGMSESVYPDFGSSTLPAPSARGYLYGTLADVEAGRRAPGLRDVTDYNPSFGGAAGAVISTLDDLHRWAPALGNGTLLEPATQAERLSWVDLAPGLQYGLGIQNEHGLLGHNGAIPGFQSYLGYDPVHHLTIVVLTNLYLTADGKEPAEALAHVVATYLRDMVLPGA